MNMNPQEPVVPNIEGGTQEAHAVFEAESQKPEIISGAIKEYAEEALIESGRNESFDVEIDIAQTDTTPVIKDRRELGNDNNEYPPYNFTLTLYKKGERGSQGRVDSRTYWFYRNVGQVAEPRVREDVSDMIEKA